MNVVIGADHRGFDLKKEIKRFLLARSLLSSITDFGTLDPNPCDYPDIAITVAYAISQDTHDRGVLICGTGIGMAMAANKFPDVRAAVCYSVDSAIMSREHNNANILCLGADDTRMVNLYPILEAWFTTGFGGGRHTARVEKIDAILKTDD